MTYVWALAVALTAAGLGALHLVRHLLKGLR